MNKIANTILIMLILFFAQVFYMNDDFTNRSYIPKSKRKWNIITSFGRQLHTYLKPTFQYWWRYFNMIGNIVLPNERVQISRKNCRIYQQYCRHLPNKSKCTATSRNQLKYANGQKLMGMMAYSTIIAQSAKTNQLSYDNTLLFDTDSAPIGIDNRCSGCISH